MYVFFRVLCIKSAACTAFSTNAAPYGTRHTEFGGVSNQTHGPNSMQAVMFLELSALIVLIYATQNVTEIHGMEISH